MWPFADAGFILTIGCSRMPTCQSPIILVKPSEVVFARFFHLCLGKSFEFCEPLRFVEYTTAINCVLEIQHDPEELLGQAECVRVDGWEVVDLDYDDHRNVIRGHYLKLHKDGFVGMIQEYCRFGIKEKCRSRFCALNRIDDGTVE